MSNLEPTSSFTRGLNSIKQNNNDRSQLESNFVQQTQGDSFQVLVRKSDLDDIEELTKLINSEQLQAFDALYNYPNLLTLFERNFLCVTMLDSSQRIIGCAVFNDFPQGLNGMIDFKHQNFWEHWIFDAFDIDQKIFVSSYNSLWLTFLFIARDAYQISAREELQIIERVFQNVYATLPQLEGILFLKRGEIMGIDYAEREVSQVLNTFFLNMPVKSKEVLRQCQGIHISSELYYSPKNACLEVMQIRMAREQDHDDLAEIFNRQSQVLTAQFGEFFIADLIATQNLTRRISRKFKSQGKAIVGQVKDKAIGLMSISTEIDYKLLSNCFELDNFDNLLKRDLMDAIRDRRAEIIMLEEQRRNDELKVKLKKLQEEKMKCHMIGQRMTLQQLCIEKQALIKLKLEEYDTEQQKQELTREKVSNMLDQWLKDLVIHQPSDLFLEFPDQYQDIICCIQTPQQLLMETLEFFGLPKGYINGEGHFKDWEEKKKEEARVQSLNRPGKNQKKPLKSKKKGRDAEIDENKPPTYFDLDPFKESFTKFTQVGPEVRAKFRKEIENRIKDLMLQFCEENGQSIKERSEDIIQFGAKLKEDKFDLDEPVVQNLASMLDCFGEIQYDSFIEWVDAKDTKDQKGKNISKMLQEKKTIANVSTLMEPPPLQPPPTGSIQDIPPTVPAGGPSVAPSQPTVVDPNKKKVQKLIKKTSFQDFIAAVNNMKSFDIMMRQLGFIKSDRIGKEVKDLQEQEAERDQRQRQLRLKKRQSNSYDDLVGAINDLEFIPNPPVETQNAFVINLFCIDENFESRSLQFVEYAFTLFPQREYIILTQPFVIPETTLLQNFIQIPRQQNSTFQHVLYIFHRDAMLMNSIFVRSSQLEDLELSLPLFETLINQESVVSDTKEAILNNASKRMSFSIFCDKYLIGIYVVSKNVHLDYLVSHFCIQDHLILSEHPKPFHTKLIHAVLNPLFSKATRFILKEILRLTNKTCLYFEVHERTLLPDIFNELVFVRTRTFPHLIQRKWDFEHDPEHYERAGDLSQVQDGARDAFDQEESPFSLSIITQKMLSEVKVSNNTRIVVVGASDTGISFIQSLLTIKEVNFTHVTVLAPGGLITMHVNKPEDLLRVMSTNYTLEELRNLMLDARVTVLDSKMVQLDKKNKKIRLDKNAILPYDILVNCVGLIDTELQNLQIISSGLRNSPYYQNLQGQRIINGVYSIDDPYLYENFQKDPPRKDSNIDLLTRQKCPQNITIYGRSLHTITFITGLLNRGVEGKRIQYVIPDSTKGVKTKFSDYKERLSYEDQCIYDPDPFDAWNDNHLENKVLKDLEEKGVKIHIGFQIKEIVKDEKSGNLSRVIITKKSPEYDNLIAEIELKKQAIEERDANSQNRSKGMIDDDNQDDNEEHQELTLEQEIEQLEQLLYIDINLDSRMMLTSGLVDIDKEIFHIIHENGLVYNGRLIVKSNFQTTENDIFCCGQICEFSQRYQNQSIGKSLRLDQYNGREMGQLLSKCILQYLELGYLTDNLYSVTELPNLFMPVGIGGYLPNGFYYYSIKQNDWAQPQQVYETEQLKQEIRTTWAENQVSQTSNEGHCLILDYDLNQQIDHVTYYGQLPVSVQSLVSLVGLSETYLNKFIQRDQSQLIQNYLEFLSENWVIALYHEWFSEFRHITQSEIMQHPIVAEILEKTSSKARTNEFLFKGKEGKTQFDYDFFNQMQNQLTPDIISSIREGTLDFIRQNQNHLPMYYVPPQKQEISLQKVQILQ